VLVLTIECTFNVKTVSLYLQLPLCLTFSVNNDSLRSTSYLTFKASEFCQTNIFMYLV